MLLSKSPKTEKHAGTIKKYKRTTFQTKNFTMPVGKKNFIIEGE